MLPSRAAVALFAGTLFSAPAGAGCSRDSRAETNADPRAAGGQTDDDTVASARRANCGHASCGNNFFVDVLPSACAAGAGCTMAIVLVATGAYHLNDEYPYKFRADQQSGLQFLGTSEAGANVFSKAANDWTKKDERTGTMAVTFKATAAGSTVVSGTFKLSVCSAQSCQLEQQPVRAAVTVR